MAHVVFKHDIRPTALVANDAKAGNGLLWRVVRVWHGVSSYAQSPAITTMDRAAAGSDIERHPAML